MADITKEKIFFCEQYWKKADENSCLHCQFDATAILNDDFDDWKNRENSMNLVVQCNNRSYLSIDGIREKSIKSDFQEFKNNICDDCNIEMLLICETSNRCNIVKYMSGGHLTRLFRCLECGKTEFWGYCFTRKKICEFRNLGNSLKILYCVECNKELARFDEDRIDREDTYWLTYNFRY